MKRYLLSGKYVFLTYSQLNDSSVSREIIAISLRSIVRDKNRDIVRIIVSLETHGDGGFHFHVFMELDSRLLVLRESSDVFDLTFSGKTYHPSFEKAKKPASVIKYVSKDDAEFYQEGFLVSDLTGKPLLETESEQGAMEKCIILVQDTGILEPAYHHLRLCGNPIFFNQRAISEFMYRLSIICSNALFRGSYLSVPPFLLTKEGEKVYDGLENYLNLGSKVQHTYQIVGRTGIGKTLLVKKVLYELNLSPLICRDLNDLRSYDPMFHDVIVFDDLSSMGGLSRSETKTLMNAFSVSESSSVRVLYGVVHIAAGVPRIFIGNHDLLLLYPTTFSEYYGPDYKSKVDSLDHRSYLKLSSDLSLNAALHRRFSTVFANKALLKWNPLDAE